MGNLLSLATTAKGATMIGNGICGMEAFPMNTSTMWTISSKGGLAALVGVAIFTRGSEPIAFCALGYATILFGWFIYITRKRFS